MKIKNKYPESSILAVQMGALKLAYYETKPPLKTAHRREKKEGGKVVQWFISVDPLAHEMPSWSSYSAFFCNPIRYVDVDGRKPGDPPTNDGKTKVKVVQKSEINITIGPQAELGAKGASGKGLGLDLTVVNFNILKISITETIDLKTGESDSDFSFDWFTGDVESSAGVKSPAGTFSVANKFKIDSDAEYIPGTQKTEYSYVSPKTTVNNVPVKGQVTYTEKSTGQTSIEAGAKTSASLKFILGVSYSAKGAVEGTKSVPSTPVQESTKPSFD